MINVGDHLYIINPCNYLVLNITNIEYYEPYKDWVNITVDCIIGEVLSNSVLSYPTEFIQTLDRELKYYNGGMFTCDQKLFLEFIANFCKNV